MCDREHLLLKIQQVEFAVIDLNLYLDTHPQDQQAVTQYNQLAQQLTLLTQQFESTYGPLINFGESLNSGSTWSWISDPWPWEFD